MEPMNITVSQIAQLLAAKIYGPTGNLKVAEHNLIVYAFNASNALLITAIASAALFAFTTAVALGSIALFSRMVVQNELETRAHNSAADHCSPSSSSMAQSQIAHYFPLPPQQRVINICKYLGASHSTNWKEDQLNIFGYVIWKNTVPV